jgi:hypothetical protein
LAYDSGECTVDPTLAPWPNGFEASCPEYTLVIAGGLQDPDPEPMRVWLSRDPSLLRADGDRQYRDFVHCTVRKYLATGSEVDMPELIRGLTMLRWLKRVPKDVQTAETRELLAAVRARRVGQAEAMAALRMEVGDGGFLPGDLHADLDLPYLARLPRAELDEEFGPALSCTSEAHDTGPDWFPRTHERCTYAGGLELSLSSDQVTAAHIDWGAVVPPTHTVAYGLPQAEPTTKGETGREWGAVGGVEHLAVIDEPGPGGGAHLGGVPGRGRATAIAPPPGGEDEPPALSRPLLSVSHRQTAASRSLTSGSCGNPSSAGEHVGYKKWTERRRSVSRMNQHKRGSQQARVDKQRGQRDRERALRRERSCQRYVRQTPWRSRDFEELLAELGLADRRAAMWGAAMCVRTALPPAERWGFNPAGVLEDSLSWALERATAEQCWASAPSLRAGAARLEQCEFSYCRIQRLYEHYASELPTACAYRAAAAVCEIPYRPSSVARALAWAAAAHAVPLASAQHELYSAAWRATCAARFDERRAWLLDQIAAARWPRVAPTTAQIWAAPAVLAVAWDRLAPLPADQSLAELVEAYGRSWRLRLSWEDPVQRAIAERAPEEPWVGEILALR